MVEAHYYVPLSSFREPTTPKLPNFIFFNEYLHLNRYICAMMMFVPDTSHQVTVSNFLRVAVLTWGKFPSYGLVTVSTLIREFEGAMRGYIIYRLELHVTRFSCKRTANLHKCCTV